MADPTLAEVILDRVLASADHLAMKGLSCDAASPTMPTTTSPMRNASPPPARHQLICACCGKRIVTAIDGLFYNPPFGSPRRFCSPACRKGAWRRRRAGVDETAPPPRLGGRSRNLRQQTHPTTVENLYPHTRR